MTRVTPPDGSAWTLEPQRIEVGICLVLGIIGSDGAPLSVQICMSRVDSRELAAGILAAGGDGMERTFDSSLGESASG